MQTFQEVLLKNLVPSKFNYRTRADEAAMEELTASVKSKGILQPVLVRPLDGKQKGKYEIVAGHRRLEAAEAAGLKQLPAMVRALSDEEALEVNVIENTQREDPNPMDEAMGFKRLLAMGKHTPDTLAAKLDRSVPYVLARVKLAELSKPVQAKIASGELPIGVAKLFTRLGNEGDQKKFLQEIIEEDGISVKRAARMLEDYTLSLTGAVFDTARCGSCQSNSGNQTALFPEIGKDDNCSDRSCFYTKTKQHYDSLVNEAEDRGFKVFRNHEEVNKLIGYNGKACKITALKKDADRQYATEAPKKYKSECAKCTEHHAYYLTEIKQSYNNSTTTRLDFGELCLNKKCLKAMQAAGKKEEKAAARPGEDESKGANPQTLRINVRECRDRFLLKALAPKVEASLALKQRLILCHILDNFPDPFGERYGEFFKKYISGFKAGGHYLSLSQVYANIAKIPAAKLVDAIHEIICLTLELTDRDVMLLMTPEAGIDMSRDFEMDEEYLNGKTKDELKALAHEIWKKDMPEAVVSVLAKATAKKSDIVKAFLAQDLIGKVPASIAAVCRLDVERPDIEEDDEDVNHCDECGEDGEDCACEGGPRWKPSEDESTEKESCTGPRCPKCDCRPCMCDEVDPEAEPTMPTPTKTKTKSKRKPGARV